MNLQNGALEGLSTFGISDSVTARLTLETRVLDIILPLAFEKLLVPAKFFMQTDLVLNLFFLDKIRLQH